MSIRKDVERVLRSAARKQEVPRLSGKRMAGEDLAGIDFTSPYRSRFGPHVAELLGADFRNSNLKGCNLARCDLASANLRGTNLENANLTEANLYTALLQSADLSNTKLCGANLISAEMQSVVVEGTDFEEARFGGTAVGGVDLSGALNLDKATHARPSSISSETLRVTAAGLGGKTDDQRRAVFRFLAHSGVDEDILQVVKSWVGMPIEFHSVFLSHSSLDKEFARKLYGDLRAVGVNCWFDEKNIFPGDRILELVDQGIKVWNKLLLVCSTNSLSPKTGWWVEQEIERALSKERTIRSAGGMETTLIPITIDDYLFNGWQSRFKSSIVDKHVGDFQNWRCDSAYLDSFERLRMALDMRRRR